jgi:hypothetical protein
VYAIYERASCPALSVVADAIASDDRLDGSPKKDVIGRIIGRGGPAQLDDVLAVTITMARLGGEDIYGEATRIRQLWMACSEPRPEHPARVGRPIPDCDPLALEVHRAIDLPGHDGVASDLPLYVRRTHDEHLRDVVDEALAGRSRLVTVVGESSTGKTRTCWELVRHIERRQPGRWWLWHPFDPTRPDAALAQLGRVGAHTVVWLNEAQHYLMTSDPSVGERVAAGLRTLLRGAGPIIVLATMWPGYWSTLTTRPRNLDPDPYAQARDLLAGTGITVANRFTPDEVAALMAGEADPRLRQAASRAEGGRITQYLAGVPVLEDRYRTAPPAAKALIEVAMDARRLGHPPLLPQALLEEAACGYLDDHDWDQLDEDWFDHALMYTAAPCNGARGPLTRVRPRNAPTDGGRPAYRLADYLEQIGRVERARVFPPDSLWMSLAANVADPELLNQFGRQATDRGRYQHAVWMYSAAVDHGSPQAMIALALMRELGGDVAGARTLWQRAAATPGQCQTSPPDGSWRGIAPGRRTWQFGPRTSAIPARCGSLRG